MNEFQYMIYMGIVEDISDPLKQGRIKVRVQGVFDNIKKEDIPYASPWRNTSGKQFSLPAVGKLVNVIFQMGDIMQPIYIGSEICNINIQNKLKSLSDDEYKNFVALLMDNRTQIYADDIELVLDYYVTSIRINKSGINLILKNNDQKINLGSADASQSAILGDAFLGWLDEFVQALLLPTSLVGNLGAPVLKPQIDSLLTKYQSLRATKFLSNNVKIVDNTKVKVVEDRTTKTNNATQDKDVTINKTPPFEPASDYNAPQSSSDQTKDVQKDKEELKSSIVDNNKKEIESLAISNIKVDETKYESTSDINSTTDGIGVFVGPSTTGLTTQDYLNGGVVVVEESQFEDISSGVYGDYTGGNLKTQEISGQDNGEETQFETSSITQSTAISETTGTTEILANTKHEGSKKTHRNPSVLDKKLIKKNQDSLETKVKIEKLPTELWGLFICPTKKMKMGSFMTCPIGWRVINGWQTLSTSTWHLHTGIDLGVENNGDILAAATGKIISYVNPKIGEPGYKKGYGVYIVLEHEFVVNGNKLIVTSLYGHNNSLANNISLGKKVEKGQLIAHAGMSGVSTGSHCHFELRNKTSGNIFDPELAIDVEIPTRETQFASKYIDPSSTNA